MSFVRWVKPRKRCFVEIQPSKGVIRLSPGLREKVLSQGCSRIDVFIDREKHLFGIKCGDDRKVSESGQVAFKSFIEWTGIKRKKKIPVMFNCDYHMFIGKI